MKGFSLVKLLKATTNDTGHDKFTYSLVVHTMRGEVETKEDVKDSDKNRDYCKGLKMRGDNKCAIRYLNTYTWVVIDELEYDGLLLQWNNM